MFDNRDNMMFSVIGQAIIHVILFPEIDIKTIKWHVHTLLQENLLAFLQMEVG